MNRAKLGHEIGYHYEDLALENGNPDKAYNSFCKNLERIREIYQSLKDKAKEFKDRYGEDWKQVMYATATKKAKEKKDERD